MIYFARAGDDGPVKIGQSKDVAKRIRELQTAHHSKLSVIRTIDAPLWVEGWLHGYFAAQRQVGEWFTYDAAMLEIRY